jgi:uncharacterized membrane protein YccC
MITAPFSSRLSRLFEHSVLTTDVARALRSSVAFTAAWVVCLLGGHQEAAVFVATAAQNVALLDVRGDYRARFAILLTMTVVMATTALAGTLVGSNDMSATLMMGAVALLGGVWRHLSGDYGPNLAVISALLFLIALSQPGGWHDGGMLALWIILGGAGAILIQMSGWFFRPQHALRDAVAESWVSASDLITAMRTETNEGQPRAQEFAGKEGELRATLDRTFATLEAAATKRETKFIAHLDNATHLAGRLATRVAVFDTTVEEFRAQPGFAEVAPTLDSVLRSLANAARSAALTLITHRAEQFVALEVRLQRCTHLIKILDERLVSFNSPDANTTQARVLLGQISELLPVVKSALADTVDHGSTRVNFPLRLPELSGLSLRSLGSWLNPVQQLDSVLVRYSLRAAVMTMLAVAIYKWFDVPRGYWIAFTVLVVLQPDYGSTRQRAGQRIAGTLAGSALGSGILWVKLPVAALICLAGVMAFCFAYFLKRRYWLAVFFVTLMLVLISEAVIPVTFGFTFSRFASTVAGGAMALVAAMFFWPKWEQEQFPTIIAAAVRANRNYLDAIAARLVAGEPFSGDAVLTKRVSERANSLASASLQRLLGEPSHQQQNVERAAALTAYNQRVTRALTVLAVNLNKRAKLEGSELPCVVRDANEALENLSQAIETGKFAPSEPKLAKDLTALAACVRSDRPRGQSSELVHSQLAKIATEIDAMTLALGTPISSR